MRNDTTTTWEANTYIPPMPINDEDRKEWFTNFDEARMKRIRAIKKQQYDEQNDIRESRP